MADLAAILKSGLPDGLVDELLRQHVRAHRRFQAGDHEGVLEAIGKFAEAAIRCGQELVTGSHTAMTAKLPAFDRVVQTIENTPVGSQPESLRIIVPRVLHTIYTIRNKRRGGHVSGEVAPQRMDALLTLLMVDWSLAELARVLSRLPLDEGQAVVDSLVQREIPLVYRDGHVHIVMRPDLELVDEVLVLLYSEPEGFTERQLVDSTKRSRSNVLSAIQSLERLRLAFKTRERPYRVRVLPTGIRAVEDRGLLATR